MRKTIILVTTAAMLAGTELTGKRSRETVRTALN